MPDDLYDYFHPNDRRVQKGSASFNRPKGVDGFAYFSKEGSLYLRPGLDQAYQDDVDKGALDVLRGYLKTFRPSFSRGLLTERDGTYSLHRTDDGVNLFLYDPEPWRPGDKVIVLKKSGTLELKQKIAELDKASSFVHGRLEELVDYDAYLVMRRYFME